MGTVRYDEPMTMRRASLILAERYGGALIARAQQRDANAPKPDFREFLQLVASETGVPRDELLEYLAKYGTIRLADTHYAKP